MKRYVFKWNRFFGFSLLLVPILWGQYVILAAIQEMAEASSWPGYVPGSVPMTIMFGLIGLLGCVLASIDRKQRPASETA